MHRLIRHFHMQRLGIRIGINRHGFDPHRLGCFYHTTGNLAPVGN